ncbi:hypothetical protein GKQ23_13075 [Erwinia sp. E602]|uniref:hypothetical protein n=1 Tax=Erwinia sp. E602 TaxID=2675378 RepID=UPI001BA5704D|nr:hypothetical protein [Erwinia sp. E602]QUG75866.1 hypothetical protein GKQ23_13075 [Erwinia sp. E602]
MAPRKLVATNSGRQTDFTDQIYIGETIQPSFPEGSSIEIIDSAANRYTFQYPYSTIKTDTWAEGMATIIIKTSTNTVRYFQIIDPISTADKYNQLMKILNEIDKVIESRLSGGGQISITINNKTLTNESLSQLYLIRASYVNRINAELAKIKGKNPDNPIKSITNFKGYR